MSEFNKPIDELMLGKEKGKITIQDVMGHVFVPYFVSWEGNWYGLDPDGNANFWGRHIHCWRLHVPPKPKVRRAQYMIVQKGEPPFISISFFKDDADFRKHITFLPGSEITRLPETEREFSE